MTARISDQPTDPREGGMPRTRARPENPEHWRLEPHVCAACFARLVSRGVGDDGDRLYQCTNCGAEAVGHRAAVVCACGIKMRKAGVNGTAPSAQVDAGLRCHENLKRSPEMPALYVASYGGAQAGSDL